MGGAIKGVPERQLVQDLEASMRKALEGDPTTVNAFEELGIEYQAGGVLRPVDEVLAESMTAADRLPDRRAQELAQTLLGAVRLR